MKKKLMLFICLEAFLIGQFVTLLVIGADYGLNCRGLNSTNKEGFYPKYYDHWPQRFYIMDQEGEVISANYNYSRSSKQIKEILSYSFCSDSLYIKCLNHNSDTIVLRPEENHGKGISCIFEQVPAYPKGSVEIQIAGNECLFSNIMHLKRIALLSIVALLLLYVFFEIIKIPGHRASTL